MLVRCFRSIILFSFLILADFTFAQTEESLWQGKKYASKSPLDSLAEVWTFNWQSANSEEKTKFKEELENLYPNPISVERVIDGNKSITRYIVNESDELPVILEKIQHSGCLIFFFKNGIPENEMKFYKTVTKYYID